MLGVVENMSGLRHRLGDFRFLRSDGDGAGGAEADVTAAVLQRIREVAPELMVSACDSPSGGQRLACRMVGRVRIEARVRVRVGIGVRVRVSFRVAAYHQRPVGHATIVRFDRLGPEGSYGSLCRA